MASKRKRAHAHNYKGERKHVTLRLPLELVKRLKLVSRESGTKLNELITSYVEERIDGHKR